MTELCCLQRSEKYEACTDEEGGIKFLRGEGVGWG